MAAAMTGRTPEAQRISKLCQQSVNIADGGIKDASNRQLSALAGG
jgi:hypothetical protein